MSKFENREILSIETTGYTPTSSITVSEPSIKSPTIRRRSRLSQKQRNVIGLLAEEFTRPQVANELNITEDTVRIYVKGALRIYNASTPGLVISAMNKENQTLSTNGDKYQNLDKNHLTEKELEILKLLTQGLQLKEIGDRLDNSPRTIHTHLSSILRVLNVGSSEQALFIALEQNLLNKTDIVIPEEFQFLQLSPAEINILFTIIDIVSVGCSYKQIAEKLQRSPKTIQLQLTSIYKKLGISDKGAAAIGFKLALERYPEYANFVKESLEKCKTFDEINKKRGKETL